MVYTDVPSTNHIYKQARFGQKYLDPSVKTFRALVSQAVRDKLRGAPEGVYEAIVIVGSPKFVTKERTVRAVDLDNMLKSTLDALQDAGTFKDERIWRIKAEKVFSDKAYLQVALIPLGDVIQWERHCPKKV